MLTVFVESSILTSNFWLSGPAYATLLNRCREEELRLVIPEVAVRETVSNYKEKLKSTYKALEKSYGEVRRLVPTWPPYAYSEDQLATAVRDYEEWLRKIIADYKINCRPIPVVDQQILLTKAIEKKRPFDSEGRGYRDELIWRSLLEYLSTYSGGDVAFLTNDSDFLDSAGSLHPELFVEVSTVLVGELTVHRSISDLYRTKIEPELTVDTESLSQFKPGSSNNAALQLWFQQTAESGLDGYPVKAGSFDVPQGTTRLDIWKVYDAGALLVEGAYVGAGSSVVLLCSSELEVNLDAHVSRSYFYRIDPDIFYIFDPDPDSSEILCSFDAKVKVKLRVSVERATAEVLSFELVDAVVHEYLQPFDPDRPGPSPTVEDDELLIEE